MMGIVARLKKHKENCGNPDEDNDAGSSYKSEKKNEIDCQSSAAAHCQQMKRKASVSEIQTPSKKSMDSFVCKTSSGQKKVIDEQVARFLFATNSSFRSIEHKEFKSLVSQLRPGYTPPSRKEVGGVLLDKIYQQERENTCKILEGQTVSMSLDGWSNVHNEPIICITVTTNSGELYLVDSNDTSGNPHTTEYLVKVAQKAISKCEADFKCFIRSLVTDNAANVKSMREELEKDKKFDILTYGCSAHLLNLLASDLQIPNVKEHVVHIVKYFRNNHFAAAKYNEEGGLKLVLPQDVRWNTMFDCLSIYIKHWPLLMKICEEHRSQIDNIVYNKVANLSIKRNAEDLVKILEPIALSLDAVQKDNCSISRAVHIWKKLEENYTEDKKSMKYFSKRYDQALDAPHFLAYLIDPRFCGSKLTELEKKAAFTFAKEKYSSTFLPIIMKFLAKADPFYDFLFQENIVTEISPLEWWKTHFDSSVVGADKKVITKAIEQLLTATASSAGVERIFSVYGLVHSKLRNKLGNEKAEKLGFLYKAYIMFYHTA